MNKEKDMLCKFCLQETNQNKEEAIKKYQFIEGCTLDIAKMNINKYLENKRSKNEEY